MFRNGSKRKHISKTKAWYLFLEVAEESEVRFLLVEFLKVVEDVRVRNST